MFPTLIKFFFLLAAICALTIKIHLSLSVAITKSFYDCIRTLLSEYMYRCLVVYTDSFFRFFCHSNDLYLSAHQTLGLSPCRDVLVRYTQDKPLYRGITWYVYGNCCETWTALDVVHLSSSAVFLRNADKKREMNKNTVN